MKSETRGPAPLAAAVLTAASLAVLACAPAQYLGRQQDDLLYLISSQAILGGGYRLFITPGSPPLVMITPGFPLLLLPLTWLFGERHAVHQAFCALLQAGLPWLLWAWLRRRCEEWAALLIPLLWATSPLVLPQAGTVMAEPAYLALCVLLLFALEKRAGGGKVGALLLALTQIRPAGLSLIPAALAPAFKEKRWKDLSWSLLAPAAGLALWSAWSFRVCGEVQEASEIALSYDGHPWFYPAAVAWDNARYYLSSWGGCYLPAAWNSAALAAGAVLAGFSVLGCRAIMKKNSREPAVLMLIGAGLMHAFWAWQYERYLIPLLPWLLWTCAVGLGKRARPVLGALLAAQLGFQSWVWMAGRSPWKAPELARTYAWLRAEGRPSDVLASPLFVRDGYHALRPSAPLPDAADPAAFTAALKARHVKRVLWQGSLDVGLSTGKAASIQRLLDRAGRHLEDPARFRLVHEEPSEGARVYEVR